MEQNKQDPRKLRKALDVILHKSSTLVLPTRDNSLDLAKRFFRSFTDKFSSIKTILLIGTQLDSSVTRHILESAVANGLAMGP